MPSLTTALRCLEFAAVNYDLSMPPSLARQAPQRSSIAARSIGIRASVRQSGPCLITPAPEGAELMAGVSGPGITELTEEIQREWLSGQLAKVGESPASSESPTSVHNHLNELDSWRAAHGNQVTVTVSSGVDMSGEPE